MSTSIELVTIRSQGALPAFDRLEDVEGSQTSVQGPGYHNGGVPVREQINTDEIINSIGYGPLQVCQGCVRKLYGNGRQIGLYMYEPCTRI